MRVILALLMLTTVTVANGLGNSSVVWEFKLLKDIPSDPDSRGTMVGRPNATTPFGFVCWTPDFTSETAHSACRAIRYFVDDGIFLNPSGIPTFIYPDYQGLVFGVNCATDSEAFPCSYQLYPGENECDQALSLDCSQGTYIPPAQAAVVYTFIFTPPTIPSDTFTTDVVNGVVSYINGQGIGQITEERVIVSSMTSSPNTPADGLTQVNVTFTFSNRSVVTDPTHIALEDAMTSFFTIYPNDVEFNLTSVIVDGVVHDRPVVPFPWVVSLVPTDTSVYAGNGLLQVRRENETEWGTVCSTGFDAVAAILACTAAGFSQVNPTIYTDGNVGPDRQQETVMWVDTVCDPRSTNINDCAITENTDPFSPIINCDHTQDVLIDCYSGEGPPIAPIVVLWTAVFNATSVASIDETFFISQLSSLVSLSGSVADQTQIVSRTVTGASEVTYQFLFVNQTSTILDMRNFFDWQLFAFARTPYFVEDTLGVVMLSSNMTEETLARYVVDTAGGSISLNSTFRGRFQILTNDGATVTGTECGDQSTTRNVAGSACRSLFENLYTPNAGILRGFGAPADINMPIAVSDVNCPIDNTFDSCSANTSPFGCDHSMDVGMICSRMLPGVPAVLYNKRVHSFNLTVSPGSDFYQVISGFSELIDIDSERFIITRSSTNFGDLNSNTNGWVEFYFSDSNVTATPRGDYEYIMLHLKDLSYLGGVNMTVVYGPPYVTPPPVPFAPSNTTGWQWRIGGGGGALRGLLEVLPADANTSTYGTVCGESFSIVAAQAVCKMITGQYIQWAYNYPMPSTSTPATGPIYAGDFICPPGTEYSGVDGCQLSTSPSGDYACSHTADVYLDCTNDPTGYTGNITFFFAAMTPDMEEFRTSIVDILEGVPTDHVVATENHTSGAYNYYNIYITEGTSSGEATMADINRQMEVLDPALLNQYNIYEYWSTITRPNGPADVTPGPSWVYSIVDPPQDLQNFTPSVVFPTDPAIGRVGRIQLQPGNGAMLGTVCSTNIRVSDEANIAVELCAAAGVTTDYGYIIQGYQYGEDMIWLGNLGWNSEANPPFQYDVSSLTAKSNDCSHLNDLGVVCGRGLRYPSAVPMLFHATYSFDPMQSDQAIIQALSQLLLITPERISVESVASNNDFTMSYANFSFLDTDISIGDITTPMAEDLNLIIMSINPGQLSFSNILSISLISGYVAVDSTTTTPTTTTTATTTTLTTTTTPTTPTTSTASTPTTTTTATTTTSTIPVTETAPTFPQPTTTTTTPTTTAPTTTTTTPTSTTAAAGTTTTAATTTAAAGTTTTAATTTAAAGTTTTAATTTAAAGTTTTAATTTAAAGTTTTTAATTTPTTTATTTAAAGTTTTTAATTTPTTTATTTAAAGTTTTAATTTAAAGTTTTAATTTAAAGTTTTAATTTAAAGTTTTAATTSAATTTPAASSSQNLDIRTTLGSTDLIAALQAVVSEGTKLELQGACTDVSASEADPNVVGEKVCVVTVTPASDATLIKSAVSANQIANVYAAADSAPAAPQGDGGGGGVPIAAIAGGIAGVVVVVAAVIGFIVYKKRSGGGGRQYEDGDDNYTPLHIPGREGGDMNIRMEDV